MNLIALLMELLFGRVLRLQPVPIRPLRRDEVLRSNAELERATAHSDACWVTGMWLTGSNPSIDSSDIAPLRMRHADIEPTKGRRNWTG